MSDATTEIWHVQLGTGEVRRWTIDELDAAFNDGAIHENTFVLQPGSTSWVKLGDAAGLGDEPVAPAPISSLSPVAMAYQTFSAPPPAYSRELDDLDLDNVQLKSSKKKTALIAAAAVAIIGLVGVTAVAAGSKDGADTALAAGAANAPANVAAAVAPPPPPTPQEPAAGQRLSDDQRSQLLAADKVLDAKMKAKAAAIAATAPHSHAARSKMKASQPFVKSHNKYDPLNGEIGGK